MRESKKTRNKTKSRRYKRIKGGNSNINNIINKLTHLVYTHFEYDDIFEIFLKQHNKHFSIMPIVVATNNKKHIEDKYLSTYKFIKHIYEYDDSKPYYDKLKSVVENVKTKYVLFNPETFVLMSDLNITLLKDILNKMDSDNADQFHFYNIGNQPMLNAQASNLQYGMLKHNILPKENILYHKRSGPWYMSIGAAIWNTNTLLDLVTKFNMKKYLESENSSVQEYASKLNNLFMTTKNNTPPPISFLKLVLTGKYQRQNPEVVKLLESYNIPDNIRA